VAAAGNPAERRPVQLRACSTADRRRSGRRPRARAAPPARPWPPPWRHRAPAGWPAGRGTRPTGSGQPPAAGCGSGCRWWRCAGRPAGTARRAPGRRRRCRFPGSACRSPGHPDPRRRSGSCGPAAAGRAGASSVASPSALPISSARSSALGYSRSTAGLKGCPAGTPSSTLALTGTGVSRTPPATCAARAPGARPRGHGPVPGSRAAAAPWSQG
jgi:hypothetical protein